MWARTCTRAGSARSARRATAPRHSSGRGPIDGTRNATASSAILVQDVHGPRVVAVDASTRGSRAAHWVRSPHDRLRAAGRASRSVVRVLSHERGVQGDSTQVRGLPHARHTDRRDPQADHSHRKRERLLLLPRDLQLPASRAHGSLRCARELLQLPQRNDGGGQDA